MDTGDCIGLGPCLIAGGAVLTLVGSVVGLALYAGGG
jgi:hypothetical protein